MPFAFPRYCLGSFFLFLAVNVWCHYFTICTTQINLSQHIMHKCHNMSFVVHWVVVDPAIKCSSIIIIIYYLFVMMFVWDECVEMKPNEMNQYSFVEYTLSIIDNEMTLFKHTPVVVVNHSFGISIATCTEIIDWSYHAPFSRKIYFIYRYLVLLIILPCFIQLAWQL